MEFDAFSTDGASQMLEECGMCGRRFNSNALARHEPICAKSVQKKRRVFDSSKQRADGTELKSVPKSKTQVVNQRQKSRPQAGGGTKNNWRAKHEDFINTIRAARGVQKAIDSGGPLPPPPPPTINPDYIQCPYCSRRFNQNAADRHINFCKEQHSRLPTKKPDASATAKFNTRKQYQVPRPVKKQSPSSANTRYQDTKTGSSRNPSGATVRPNAMGNTTNGNYSASRYSDYGTESPNSGRALRTGRTAEMYSEARELSAKQRSSMPRKNTPVKTSTRYGGYGSSQRPDNGYHSGDSDSLTLHLKQKGNVGSAGMSKFCHECGSKYPVTTAKFCCECGMKRVH